MEGDVTRLSLGNVSVNGRKMRDERFARSQQSMTEDFIRFLGRQGAPKFTVIDNLLKNDGYQLKIRYNGPVDMRYRREIEMSWKNVKITTHKEFDSIFLPFKDVRGSSNMAVFDAALFLGLLVIMIMCVYIQMLNKPQRYGDPLFHVFS